ncbi:MAG: cupredoxin domain-containing protein [Chloroflexota bacterium]
MRHLVGFFIALIAVATLGGFAQGEEKRFVATVDADGVQRIDMTAGEYYFDPNYVVVKVNVPVEIKIGRNSGITPHDIVLEALDAGISVKEDVGTAPKVIRFTPTKAGKYPFYCTKKFLFFKSHRERGMEGTLEVVQ